MGIDFDERWRRRRRRRSSFESPNYHCFQGIEVSLKGLLDWAYIVSTMGTKMKGICKGFKYISQIFVVKEQEMEIGYPTDVKHVAHIGWDGQSGNAPSWMNEFKTGSAASLNNLGAPNSLSVSTWSSQDFEQNIGRQPVSEIYKNSPPTDLPKAPKKHRRKKSKSTTSSPRSSSRSSRVEKSKLSFVSTTVNLVERTPNLLGVPP